MLSHATDHGDRRGRDGFVLRSDLQCVYNGLHLGWCLIDYLDLLCWLFFGGGGLAFQRDPCALQLLNEIVVGSLCPVEFRQAKAECPLLDISHLATIESLVQHHLGVCHGNSAISGPGDSLTASLDDAMVAVLAVHLLVIAGATSLLGKLLTIPMCQGLHLRCDPVARALSELVLEKAVTQRPDLSLGHGARVLDLRENGLSILQGYPAIALTFTCLRACLDDGLVAGHALNGLIVRHVGCKI
mmetsp:Transcript_95480/g.169527  ORF Transcript_95480/g.169527 Transcript_95480/m.169527 type:complete len:243 (-) Transcript_95480:38-766(-)